MLERLVEFWLTSVGELGYQTPFAQLMLAEGHLILQGPVHYPYEHGKDILTFDPEGRLCAFQLKGPNEISDLNGLEKYQGQLDALAMAAIEHPAVGERRLADRVYVVTNGVLRPEVRDRLNQISAGNVQRRLPPLEYVEREQLVSRFLAIHGRYTPSNPADFRRFVQLYGDEGRGPLPTLQVLEFLEGIVPFGVNPSEVACQRALTSAALFTAYTLRGWETAENHLAVAQGWLLYCCVALRLASEQSLGDVRWAPSYELAFAAARAALHRLLNEALQRQDLVQPHIAEGMFYGTRALQVCGYVAAHFLSERHFGAGEVIAGDVRSLLEREARYLRAVGEAAAPLLFAIASAESILTSSHNGEALVHIWASTLIASNQPGSVSALPDPYHSLEEVLGFQVGGTGSDLDVQERYDGHVYSAHVAIEWLARRLRRQAVSALWRDYTRVIACEFECSSPAQVLTLGDDEGRLAMRMPEQPGSWAKLRERALLLQIDRLPPALRTHPEFLPFLGLLLPPRFTSMLAAAVDYIWFPTADFNVVEAVVAQPAKRRRKGKSPPRRSRGA